jgi:hypothetical protein
MRLAAIQRRQPLRGAELVRTWRARAEQYPDQLVDVMIERSLTAGTLAGGRQDMPCSIVATA